ncbi:MAG: TonB-dependent receptor, partial [Bryobacteraceae bacterium]
KQLSAHSLKFGFSMEFGYENGPGAGGWVTAPQFSFSQGFTSGPNVVPGLTTSGNALASLLLGTGSGGNGAITAPLAEGHHDYGLYLQDAWRVNRRLTLNVGLRYELQQPSTDRYNRYSSFNSTIPSPLAGPAGLPLKGGLVFLKDTNLGRGAWDTQHTNFSPRVSFAYKLTDKLVARGGYGIFYLPLLGLGTLDGYSLNTNFQTSVGGAGQVPLDVLSNPFPRGLQAPPGSALGLLTDVGAGVPFQQRHSPNGYVENYSFDLQYQIGSSSVLEVGYSGNQGHHLTYNASINVDQLNPQYLSLGNQLNAQVPNPFYGTAGATGVYTGPTTALWRLLVPYPQFTGVSLQAPPAANSNFNALIVKFSHRMSHGLTTMVNYQFAKAIDDASETQAWEEHDSGTRDAYNWNLDRSISAHDIPQSLALTLVYDIPVGKGRTFGTNMNKIVEGVAGGWQVASIMNWQTGIPDYMTAPGNGFGFAYQPPNITKGSDIPVQNQSVQEWFNTAAFSKPATYTIGTAPRRITQLRQDGVHSADVSVMKNFMVREPLKLQVRAEFFNISNTPQFAAPNTSVGSNTFGQVTGLWNTPRDIQFGLRLDF